MVGLGVLAVACAPQSDAPKSPEVAAAPAPTAVAATTPDRRPLYEEVIRLLREDNSVIPARPKIHPVHTLYNREAIIPPMCYTKTEGTHNPCYVCHQDEVKGRPNFMGDGDLQVAYSFSELGQTNHWKNLFEDRTDRVAQISDEEILNWVSQDNYTGLAQRLREANWEGYVPDLENLQMAAAAFDDEGFAKDGSHWVAFNYKPLPSTFWPTNGATDDVMIRLPEAFRTTEDGKYSRDVYKANLAIVEANLKGMDRISVRGVDEKAVGVDLDGNGRLRRTNVITNVTDYVGAAKGYLKLAHLYPLDTEFLHSVRYLGVDEAGNIFVPKRMKELRYMRKRFTLTVPHLYEMYLQERYAKDDGTLPGFVDRGQYGLDNEMGWVIQGFIENRQGDLRVNNYEENFFCMGCHTSIGSTFDNVFSFARKIDGADGWGYVNLRGMPDAPNLGETKGEIATYFERAGGGGEFRSNPEMEARWFDNGQVASAKVAAAKDVYELVTPSRERALQLNKAYRVIVDDQDYLYGRDPTVTRPPNVYDVIDNKEAPTLPPEKSYRWDMRLDWGQVPKN